MARSGELWAKPARKAGSRPLATNATSGPRTVAGSSARTNPGSPCHDLAEVALVHVLQEPRADRRGEVAMLVAGTGQRHHLSADQLVQRSIVGKLGVLLDGHRGCCGSCRHAISGYSRSMVLRHELTASESWPACRSVRRSGSSHHSALHQPPSPRAAQARCGPACRVWGTPRRGRSRPAHACR